MTEEDASVPVRRVAWISSSTDFGIASLRYRMVYPAAFLQKLGWDNVITVSPDSLIKRLHEFDAIVIVKRLDPSIIRIVSEANDAGVPILLDMCDDILDQDYRATGHELFRIVFDAIAPRLSAIVTTGSFLKRRFEHYGFKGPIHVIPDCIETLALAKLGRDFLNRSKNATSGQIAKTVELVRIQLSLGGTFLFRMYKAFRHPRRSLLDPRHTLRTILYGDLSQSSSVKSAFDSTSLIEPYFLESMKDKRRSLIWFGNHGGPHSDFGMATLLKIGPELREAHRRSAFVLMVVSNDYEKWKHLIEPIGVPTRFVPWSHEGTLALLSKARAFIMPTGEDSFSLGKSANRVTLALEQNTPVIAEFLESLDWMATGVHRHGIADAIVECVEHRESSVQAAQALRTSAHEHFSISQIAELWKNMIETLKPYTKSRATYGDLKLPEKLIVLINNATDRPIGIAVLDAARKLGVDTGLIVSQEACFRNPQLIEDLVARRISPTFITRLNARRTDYRWLRNATALFCPSESDLPAHAIPHWLTKIANQCSVRTYTSQHGLSNIALTDPGTKDAAIASGTIFTWNEPSTLPDWVEPSIRQRSIATGRITDPSAKALKNLRSLDRRPERIGIFENLHWSAYSDGFRSAFKTMITALAERHPDTKFVIMPHPAGLWSVKFIKTAGLPTNLTIANPASREHLDETGINALASVDRVLTTPSSIAADAACIGLPAIILAPENFDLSLFQGLKFVRSAEEASAALFDTPIDVLNAGTNAFLAASMLEATDAAERAVRIMFPSMPGAASDIETQSRQLHSASSL
ncbi:MAG: glycosyltransferase [Pannonibacter sp.]